MLRTCLIGTLRYANLTVTEVYAHVSIDKLHKIHTDTHPAKLPPIEQADDAIL